MPADENPRRGMLVPEFRPAAAYLVEGPPRLARHLKMIRVVDADVGAILTDARDTEVGQSIRSAKTWAPGEGRFLRETLRPGMRVIDIGANIGYFTLLMANMVGAEGRVLAVEADPDTVGILRANLELRDSTNVEVLPVVATRSRGIVTVSRCAGNLGGHKGFVAAGADEYIPVQGIRLDDALDPAAPIDFVKVDVEGMDHAAIEGLERSIRQWRPLLLVEFNPANIEAFGDDPHEVLRFYRGLGLQVSVLGTDALLLRDAAGLDLDELVREGLIVMPRMDTDLIERTRHIGLINLILRPR